MVLLGDLSKIIIIIIGIGDLLQLLNLLKYYFLRIGDKEIGLKISGRDALTSISV